VYFHSIEYHLENQKLPFWERCAHYKEYPSSEMVKLLLGKDVPANRVCSSFPTCVQLSVSLIVSMKAVKDPKISEQRKIGFGSTIKDCSHCGVSVWSKH